MKKLSMTLSLLIALLVVLSCKKNEINSLVPDEISALTIAKYNAIKSLPSAQAKKLSFTSLDPTEKADFWQYHITLALKDLTEQQKELLKEIKNRFVPAIFVEGSTEREIMTSLYIGQWLNKADKIFKADEIGNIFYFLQKETPSIVKSNKNDGTEVKAEALPDCMCNLGSAYTCPKVTYHMGTDGIWGETTYGSCSNQAPGCKEDNWGCGLGGLFYCNGNKCTY